MKRFLSIFAIAATLSFSADAQGNTKMKAGEVAPELAFNNPADKKVSLKEVNKGRYILLDFWASWCGPCRASNPELVTLYNKFKTLKFKNAPNGFTVFSVSLDGNKTSWTNAIQADGLAWEYHISDLKKWSSEAAVIYGVQFIPQAFLLGPDGKIIGKYDTALKAAAELEKYIDNGTQATKKTTNTKRKTTAGKK